MKFMRVAVLFFLMEISFGAQQPPKVTIEGSVFDVRTGEPVAGAWVTLTKTTLPGQSQSPILPDSRGILADDRGGFKFQDLEPGPYQIVVAADSYVRHEYRQKVFGGTVVIRLTRTGNVSGHIRTTDGQPAVGAPVQLLQFVYNNNGQKTLAPAGSARTDDRGEYRLYWITPGRYFVSAGSTAEQGLFVRPVEAGGAGNSPNENPNERYSFTFYPGVSDLKSAAIVEVQPGTELSTIDFVAPRQQLYRIRGRIVDSRTGTSPATARPGITYRGMSGGGGMLSRPAYNPADGTFEISDIPSGSYYVSVSSPDNSAGTPSVPVTITNSDVEGIVLTISPLVSIEGRLTVEGQLSAAASGLTRLVIILRPWADGEPLNAPSSSPPPQTPNSDGAFTISGTIPGEYRLSFYGLPTDLYVKEIRYNNRNVLDETMQISASDAGTLSIVLSAKSGQVAGTVVDERLQPVPGIEAVLVPDRQRERTELFKTVLTDQAGRFNIRGIPPGDYKIFAWEALEPRAYFDPQVLAHFEQQGKAVHVAESSTQDVQVKLIPGEN
jgi:protocatechuate 3,4-dioxygenase beta subunit